MRKYEENYFIGGIVNRFSRDLGIADEDLHWTWGDMNEVCRTTKQFEYLLINNYY